MRITRLKLKTESIIEIRLSDRFLLVARNQAGEGVHVELLDFEVEPSEVSEDLFQFDLVPIRNSSGAIEGYKSRRVGE